MSYKVVLSPSFRHSVKKLQKRFPHVKDDVREEIRVLLTRPRKGSVIPGGSGARKTRVRNSDLGKGKSSGYRLIYCFEEQPMPTLYLLLLYSKSDRENVNEKELKELIQELQELD